MKFLMISRTDVSGTWKILQNLFLRQLEIVVFLDSFGIIKVSSREIDISILDLDHQISKNQICCFESFFILKHAAMMH